MKLEHLAALAVLAAIAEPAIAAPSVTWTWNVDQTTTITPMAGCDPAWQSCAPSSFSSSSSFSLTAADEVHSDTVGPVPGIDGGTLETRIDVVAGHLVDYVLTTDLLATSEASYSVLTLTEAGGSFSEYGTNVFDRVTYTIDGNYTLASRSAVPEPASAVLLLAGLGLLARRRRGARR